MLMLNSGGVAETLGGGGGVLSVSILQTELQSYGMEAQLPAKNYHFNTKIKDK